MRSAFTASLFLVLSLTATAPAQGKDTFDSLTGEMVKQLQKIGDTLKTITDKKSAQDAKPALVEVGKAMESIQARVEKLGKPSAEEGQVLEKKYKEEIQKAAARIQSEGVRLATVDGAAEVLKELGALFDKKKKQPKK